MKVGILSGAAVVKQLVNRNPVRLCSSSSKDLHNRMAQYEKALIEHKPWKKDAYHSTPIIEYAADLIGSIKKYEFDNLSHHNKKALENELNALNSTLGTILEMQANSQINHGQIMTLKPLAPFIAQHILSSDKDVREASLAILSQTLKLFSQHPTIRFNNSEKEDQDYVNSIRKYIKSYNERHIDYYSFTSCEDANERRLVKSAAATQRLLDGTHLSLKLVWGIIYSRNSFIDVAILSNKDYLYESARKWGQTMFHMDPPKVFNTLLFEEINDNLLIPGFTISLRLFLTGIDLFKSSPRLNNAPVIRHLFWHYNHFALQTTYWDGFSELSTQNKNAKISGLGAHMPWYSSLSWRPHDTLIFASKLVDRTNTPEAIAEYAKLIENTSILSFSSTLYRPLQLLYFKATLPANRNMRAEARYQLYKLSQTHLGNLKELRPIFDYHSLSRRAVHCFTGKLIDPFENEVFLQEAEKHGLSGTVTMIRELVKQGDLKEADKLITDALDNNDLQPILRDGFLLKYCYRSHLQIRVEEIKGSSIPFTVFERVFGTLSADTDKNSLLSQYKQDFKSACSLLANREIAKARQCFSSLKQKIEEENDDSISNIKGSLLSQLYRALYRAYLVEKYEEIAEEKVRQDNCHTYSFQDILHKACIDSLWINPETFRLEVGETKEFDPDMKAYIMHIYKFSEDSFKTKPSTLQSQYWSEQDPVPPHIKSSLDKLCQAITGGYFSRARGIINTLSARYFQDTKYYTKYSSTENEQIEINLKDLTTEKYYDLCWLKTSLKPGIDMGSWLKEKLQQMKSYIEQLELGMNDIKMGQGQQLEYASRTLEGLSTKDEIHNLESKTSSGYASSYKQILPSSWPKLDYKTINPAFELTAINNRLLAYLEVHRLTPANKSRLERAEVPKPFSDFYSEKGNEKPDYIDTISHILKKEIDKFSKQAIWYEKYQNRLSSAKDHWSTFSLLMKYYPNTQEHNTFLLNAARLLVSFDTPSVAKICCDELIKRWDDLTDIERMWAVFYSVICRYFDGCFDDVDTFCVDNKDKIAQSLEFVLEDIFNYFDIKLNSGHPYPPDFPFSKFQRFHDERSLDSFHEMCRAVESSMTINQYRILLLFHIAYPKSHGELLDHDKLMFYLSKIEGRYSHDKSIQLIHLILDYDKFVKRNFPSPYQLVDYLKRCTEYMNHWVRDKGRDDAFILRVRSENMHVEQLPDLEDLAERYIANWSLLMPIEKKTATVKGLLAISNIVEQLCDISQRNDKNHDKIREKLGDFDVEKWQKKRNLWMDTISNYIEYIKTTDPINKTIYFLEMGYLAQTNLPDKKKKIDAAFKNLELLPMDCPLLFKTIQARILLGDLEEAHQMATKLFKNSFLSRDVSSGDEERDVANLLLGEIYALQAEKEPKESEKAIALRHKSIRRLNAVTKNNVLAQAVLSYEHVKLRNIAKVYGLWDLQSRNDPYIRIKFVYSLSLLEDFLSEYYNVTYTDEEKIALATKSIKKSKALLKELRAELFGIIDCREIDKAMHMIDLVRSNMTDDVLGCIREAQNSIINNGEIFLEYSGSIKYLLKKCRES